MKLEPVIGLEVHIQLKTKSKMFCPCPNIFGDVKPNTAICPICMGYPGTLPVPNKTAIAWTQRAGAAVNCQLAHHSKFDRKSYFYPDLPKGYQISQYDQPFCGEGQLEIIVEGQPRVIGIERIHLEEDAAKNTHPKGADYTLIDYNRAGTPLMELVTKPDLRSPLEAKLFLQELQRIMRAIGVSDADMEKGQMRCDANISLREVGSTTLHPKTEIKNVNSFRFVEKALQYEIKRQTQVWQESGPPATQSTRGYDAEANKTYEQRTKEEAADYRYFPEPDIPPFEFTDLDLAAAKQGLPELPTAKRVRLMHEYGLTDHQASLLIEDSLQADFFEACASELQQLDKEQDSVETKEVPALLSLAVNMITRHLRAIREALLPGETLKISPENFGEVVVMVQSGRINKGAIPEVLREMQATGGDPDPIIAQLNLEQVSSTDELSTIVDQVIAANKEIVAKIKAGKEGALQFLMGQVMKETKGRANPAEVVKILQEKLK